MPRALVILPTGGYRAADFVDAARSIGVELAVASDRPDPLAAADRFVLVDCDDARATADTIIELALDTPIDAIVAADDSGVEAAALASEALGLDHHPPVAVRATRDKALLRRRLARAEVPQPGYLVVQAGDVPAAAGELGYPVVIKPRTLTASRGVLRVDDPNHISDVVDRIQQIRMDAGEDPDSELVVERFVPGPEFTVEGLMWGGSLEVLAVMEKPEPLDGPAFQETIFVTPARIPPGAADDLIDTVRRSVDAIGLSDGPIHAEARMSPDGPVLLEVAARTIGGLCGRALRFGLLGTSLEALVLRNALGLRRTLPRPDGASGVLMIPIPRPGRLAAVHGVDDVRQMANVHEVELTSRPGDRLAPPPEGDRYLGFVFARAATTDEVVTSLRSAMSVIDVDMAGAVKER